MLKFVFGGEVFRCFADFQECATERTFAHLFKSEAPPEVTTLHRNIRFITRRFISIQEDILLLQLAGEIVNMIVKSEFMVFSTT